MLSLRDARGAITHYREAVRIQPDFADAWSRLGTGLPNASVNDLSLAPDGSYLIAATQDFGLDTRMNLFLLQFENLVLVLVEPLGKASPFLE